jgi:hypothetical protein
MFHGHVIKRTDGLVARCGGPALCKECRFEQRMVELHAPDCQMLRQPPQGFPFDAFSCNCDRIDPNDPEGLG